MNYYEFIMNYLNLVSFSINFSSCNVLFIKNTFQNFLENPFENSPENSIENSFKSGLKNSLKNTFKNRFKNIPEILKNL